MNENTVNSGNDFFYDLLDNPVDLSHSNAFNLQLLINDFPQSGLLRAMLSVKREQEGIERAGAYVNPKALYKIANAVGSLPAVSNHQIAFAGVPQHGKPGTSPMLGTVEPPNLMVDEANYFHVPIDPELIYAEEESDEEIAILEEDLNDEAIEQERENDDVQLAYNIKKEAASEALPDTDNEATDQNEAELEIAVTPSAEIDKPQTYKGETEEKADKTKPSHEEIDDEIFEEIVSIEDIGLEQLALMDKAVDDEADAEATVDEPETKQAPAGDSYFVFEPTLPEDGEHPTPAKILTENTASNQGRQGLSRYNDDKMPYSFMWWLDKTRKEHAAIYQPFAVEGKFHTETVTTAVEKPQPTADHLQQQYVENIFAATAVVSDLNVTPPKVEAPPVETKADKIIEKFINEEPQIKHPNKVKLDSENKAKKSSEDRNELVTETLAQIYTEQMLYHKAILTYKKLMLKFPEKSLYFAGQIDQLENKINK